MGQQVRHIFISSAFEFFERKVTSNYYIFSCDLSFVSEFMSSTHNNLIEVLESVKNNIIINQSDIVWYISKKDGSDIIDIVLDNAGYELFTDICLAVVLCTYKLANKIRFHVKKYPWYVSDTTIHDFFWTLQYINEFSLDKDVKQLAAICHRFLGTNTWIIEVYLISITTLYYLIFDYI